MTKYLRYVTNNNSTEDMRIDVVHDHGVDTNETVLVDSEALHFPAFIFFIYAFLYFHFEAIFTSAICSYLRVEFVFESGVLLLGAALALEFPIFQCGKGQWSSVLCMIIIVVHFIVNVFIVDTLQVHDDQRIDPFMRPFTIGSWMFFEFQVIDLIFYLQQDTQKKDTTIGSIVFAALGSLSFYVGGLLHFVALPYHSTAMYTSGGIFYLLHAVCSCHLMDSFCEESVNKM